MESKIEKFLDYAAENGLIEESMFRRQQKKVIIPTHMKNPWPEGLKKLMGISKGGQGSGRLPDPAGQKCPKCGKEFHDNKWGGAGKCDCGHYFHPEWYGKPKNV